MIRRAVQRVSKTAATVVVAALGLAACDVGLPQTAPRPPIIADPSPPAATALPQSAASAAAQAYYAQVQQALLSQGLLRTDGGGADTPYNDRMLAENFIRIALFDEFARDGGGATVQRQTIVSRVSSSQVMTSTNSPFRKSNTMLHSFTHARWA